MDPRSFGFGALESLDHWGRRGKLLSVRCDASKPLEAIVSSFTGDESDPVISRQCMKGNREAMGWKLLEPVAFVDSRNHPAVQLADIVAGAARVVSSGQLVGLEVIGDYIGRHLHPHTIWPDTQITERRPSTPSYLYDLAKRAERGANPHDKLDIVYRLAEIGWAKGEFGLTKYRKE